MRKDWIMLELPLLYLVAALVTMKYSLFTAYIWPPTANLATLNDKTEGSFSSTEREPATEMVIGKEFSQTCFLTIILYPKRRLIYIKI